MNLSFIIPVYNSASSMDKLLKVFEGVPEHIKFELILVNDSSPDGSGEIIRKHLENLPYPTLYLELSHNYGEHNAVMAGLNYAKGDFIITMDDDMQNPLSEAIKLYEETKRSGNDVVYSQYHQKKHSTFRNLGSQFTNKLQCWTTNKPKNLYLSSFRCLRNSLVKKVTQYQGPFPYIDGIILQHTCKIGTLYVEHKAREEGESGYTLKKLIRLWMSTLINFSVLPLRIATFVGFTLSIASFVGIVAILIEYFGCGVHPEGWTFLAIVVLLFAGVQLISLGLLGEYIGRIYLTLNKKPQFSLSCIESSSLYRQVNDDKITRV